MYKLPAKLKTINGDMEITNTVIRIEDNAFIPFDPDNTDAKQFAKWLSEGGVPESAVEGDVVDMVLN